MSRLHPGPASAPGSLLGGVRPDLVALDIDGTLLRYDGVLSAAVREAIDQVRAGGAHVVLATGRELFATLPILRRLGIDEGWAVCSNGAVTVRLDPDLPEGYRLARAVTFDPTLALTLLRVTFPEALFAVEEPGKDLLVTAPFPDGELEGPVNLVSFERLLTGIEVTRVVVRSPERTPDEFWPLVEKAGLHGVSFSVGYTAWLDIGPQGVTKASALERLRADLGVSPGATLAVGDWTNDLEMFAWAARAVAMGQAREDVRLAADAVTGPVEEDGLVAVLDEVVGIRAAR